MLLHYMFDDALDLLKEQEAKVMTLEELNEIMSRNKGVWPYDTPPYLSMEVDPSFRWVETHWVAWRDIAFMIGSQHITYTAENYGKIWRIWSRHPTPEQMGNPKWEEGEAG